MWIELNPLIKSEKKIKKFDRWEEERNPRKPQKCIFWRYFKLVYIFTVTRGGGYSGESTVHRNPYETHNALDAIRTQDADLAVKIKLFKKIIIGFNPINLLQLLK
jgi:hypothetical protein